MTGRGAPSARNRYGSAMPVCGAHTQTGASGSGNPLTRSIPGQHLRQRAAVYACNGKRAACGDGRVGRVPGPRPAAARRPRDGRVLLPKRAVFSAWLGKAHPNAASADLPRRRTHGR